MSSFEDHICPNFNESLQSGNEDGGLPNFGFCSKEYKSAMVSLFEEKSVNNNSKGVRMPVGGFSKSEQVGVVQSFVQIVRGIICWFGEAKDGMIAEIINVCVLITISLSIGHQ